MTNILIDIDLGGATEIKVQGCPGPSCKQLTEAIEKALGTVTSDVKTPEYHHAAKQGQQAQAGAQ